jgi:hypothetical protein
MGFAKNLASILASVVVAVSAFGQEKTIYRELYEEVEKLGGKFAYKDNISFDVWSGNNELTISVLIGYIGIICYDKGCDGLDEFHMINLNDFGEVKRTKDLEKGEYLHRTKQLLYILGERTKEKIR